MSVLIYEKKTLMPCSAERLFIWHETLPYAFNKLIPPGEPVQILHHDGHVQDGSQAVLMTGRGPFRFRWELRHEGYEANRRFADRQISGPFKSWYHVHHMIPLTDTTSLLHDRVEFEMPCGPLGTLIGKLFVMPKLEKLFTYRHTATREDLEQIA